MLARIEQVFLQGVESLDELLGVLVGEQRVDERQAIGDLVPAGIVSRVGQLLEAVRATPASP